METYRSKFGMIMSILLYLKNNPASILSNIARSSHMTLFTLKSYLTMLETSKMITIEILPMRKKKQLIKINYSITERGIEFHKKCEELVAWLPNEFKI